jgi:hypothetical protein
MHPKIGVIFASKFSKFLQLNKRRASNFKMVFTFCLFLGNNTEVSSLDRLSSLLQNGDTERVMQGFDILNFSML